MNAFSAAVDAIFADPNMAADAVWQNAAQTRATECRVIRKAPDELTDYGGAQLRSATTVIDVRVSDLCAVADGDLFMICDERFRVHGAPRRDRERLVWTVDLRPA